MKLVNLLNMADDRISIMLTGITADDKEIGYDFVNKKWREDNIFIPERVIRMRDFRKFHNAFYNDMRSKNLHDFSTFSIDKIEALKELKTFRGSVCLIKIYMVNPKSIKTKPDSKAVNRRKGAIKNRTNDRLIRSSRMATQKATSEVHS